MLGKRARNSPILPCRRESLGRGVNSSGGVFPVSDVLVESGVNSRGHHFGHVVFVAGNRLLKLPAAIHRR